VEVVDIVIIAPAAYDGQQNFKAALTSSSHVQFSEHRTTALTALLIGRGRHA